MKILPTEEMEQAALVRYCMMRGYPFNALFAIPNGGKRHMATAKRLKATGVRAGVPDLCWPVARKDYHGLFIEMKRIKGGTLSAHQKAMIAMLEAEGHRVAVCAGFEVAK